MAGYFFALTSSEGEARTAWPPIFVDPFCVFFVDPLCVWGVLVDSVGLPIDSVDVRGVFVDPVGVWSIWGVLVDTVGLSTH